MSETTKGNEVNLDEQHIYARYRNGIGCHGWACVTWVVYVYTRNIRNTKVKGQRNHTCLLPYLEITGKPHNLIVHNISYNLDVCLDLRMIKFVYTALNHSNEICHNLLHTKLNCMRSTFSENYQYLSYKYQLSDRDWYKDIEHLLGKVKVIF